MMTWNQNILALWRIWKNVKNSMNAYIIGLEKKALKVKNGT